jgi:hypothetical protein
MPQRPPSQVHRFPGAEAFIRRSHNAHGLQRVVHVVVKIDPLPNRLEEKLLLTVAQAVVIRLIFQADHLVRLGKSPVRAQAGMMNPQALSLRVPIHIGTVSLPASGFSMKTWQPASKAASANGP